MKRLQSKIAGSVYGFAIGDAMGATTEFMHPHEIKAKYGKGYRNHWWMAG